MNATHTWKDTIGCAAVLVAILVGTVSGAYVAYTDTAPVAAVSYNFQA